MKRLTQIKRIDINQPFVEQFKKPKKREKGKKKKEEKV